MGSPKILIDNRDDLALDVPDSKPISDGSSTEHHFICGNVYFKKILMQFRRKSQEGFNGKSHFISQQIELKK